MLLSCLFLFYALTDTAIEAKPYVILDSFKNCDPRPSAYYNWTRTHNPSNESFRQDGHLIVSQEIESIDKVRIDLHSCEEQAHRVVKCKYFNTLKLGARGRSACPIVYANNVLWTPYISAFRPVTKNCPIKVGDYRFTNASFDMNRMIPLAVSIWKATIAMYTPSRPSVPSICVNIDFKMRYSSRT